MQVKFWRVVESADKDKSILLRKLFVDPIFNDVNALEIKFGTIEKDSFVATFRFGKLVEHTGYEVFTKKNEGEFSVKVTNDFLISKGLKEYKRLTAKKMNEIILLICDDFEYFTTSKVKAMMASENILGIDSEDLFYRINQAFKHITVEAKRGIFYKGKMQNIKF